VSELEKESNLLAAGGGGARLASANGKEEPERAGGEAGEAALEKARFSEMFAKRGGAM
jgi:hypothetical protein